MASYIVQSLIVLLSLLNIAFFANAANILAILPSVWKSHFIYGRRLMQQLVEHNRNHSVTLISPHANENDTEQLQNIREIRVEGLLQNWEEMGMSFDIEQMRSQSGMERFTRLIYAGTTNVDLLLTDAQVRALLQSGEHFDLIVIDLFLNDALLGFSFLNKAPTVVLSPTGSNTWLNHMLGNPQNSAVDPSNFLPFTERMNIWERSVNTLMLLFEKLTYNFFHMITQQAVYAKHFQAFSEHANRTLLHHRELTKNLSLVLLNSNAILQYPRAHLPNMLTIAGAHLQRSGDLLIPKHLLEFIETASQGVVYMSFGANIRTADLPIEKLNILLDVFEYLKDLRFLLKWENEHDDNINLPANVMINEWFPQEAILAHNNVKLFISSCGLMSIVEAINGATPMLAIPIYSEHAVAARRLQSQNVALIIQYEDIAYDSLLYSIKQLVYTPSYSLSMQKLRRQFNYNSISPSKNALHYIELILQTNGGDFLKSHANNLNFLRTELLDVILIIAIGVGCIIAVPFFVTCCILRKSYQAAAEGEEARDGRAYHAKLLKVMGRSNSYTDGEQEARMRRRGSTTSASITTTTSSSSSTSLYNPSGIYNKSI